MRLSIHSIAGGQAEIACWIFVLWNCRPGSCNVGLGLARGLLLLHCSTYLVVILINVIQEIIHRLEKQFASEFDPLRDHSVPKSNHKFFKE